MIISGPERYDLSILVDGDEPTFKIRCARGTTKFSGLAVTKLPKLYVVSIDNVPIYVGATRQTMSRRLALGSKADGEGVYHGYAFRRKAAEAVLHIWAHEDAGDHKHLDIETLEAEVVFLIRQAGQWPAFQTEIHFHPSQEVHRELARRIVGAYGI